MNCVDYTKICTLSTKCTPIQFCNSLFWICRLQKPERDIFKIRSCGSISEASYLNGKTTTTKRTTFLTIRVSTLRKHDHGQYQLSLPSNECAALRQRYERTQILPKMRFSRLLALPTVVRASDSAVPIYGSKRIRKLEICC